MEYSIPNLNMLKLKEYQALINGVQKDATVTVNLSDEDIIMIISKFFNVSCDDVYLSTNSKPDRDGDIIHVPYSQVKVRIKLG